MVRSGSDSDSRSAGSSSSTKVQRRSADSGEVGLVSQAWNLAKQLFFTVVHVYKSLTTFWSQMHVCMLPALGELDNEGENGPEEDEEPAAAVASTSSRKSTKVN